MQKQELDKVIKFILNADKIKAIRREGWVIRKLPIYEHVGDHSFSTALISYIIARKKGLDASRCLIMSLIHDVHEAITGDIPTRPHESMQRVSNAQKQKLEIRDTARMLALLPSNDKRHIEKLWVELKNGKTKEAQLVKQVDALDYILELWVHSPYTKAQRARIEEFFITADARIRDKDLRYIFLKAKSNVLG